MRILKFSWCVYLSNRWFEVEIRVMGRVVEVAFYSEKIMQERNRLPSSNCISFAIVGRFSIG